MVTDCAPTRRIYQWLQCRISTLQELRPEGFEKGGGGGSECASRSAGTERSINDHATVPAGRDPDSRASARCVRGPYYECNVRGYAVIPVVEIRCHQYRVNRVKKSVLV